MQEILTMNRATPSMRAFAKRLMIYERIETRGSRQTAIPAGFVVCEKLRLPLAAVMGNGGYRALVTRALALANSEGPWLRAVRVNADGSLGGLEDLHVQLKPAELFEGSVVLLAHMLASLVAFIGDDMTFHLVSEAWPDIPPNALEFNNGKPHEKGL